MPIEAAYPTCAAGTDCADCGIRAVCISCPDECAARSVSQSAGSCLEAMWNDGVCDPECNFPECGHNDCTESEIVSACVGKQQADAAFFTSAPINSSAVAHFAVAAHRASTSLGTGSAGLGSGLAGRRLVHRTTMQPAEVPVAVEVKLSALKLDINTDNQMVLTTQIETKTMWSDPRLERVPCYAALTSMLSTEVGDTAAERATTVGYQETIWLPTAIYEGSLTDTLIESSFEMPMGMQPWAVGTPPPLSSANCTGCASYTDIRKVEVTQPYETFKDYQFYPFDDHVVAITLTLRGGVVINCPSVLTTHFESAAGTSAEDSWMSILFPQAASSWYLQNDRTDVVSKAPPRVAITAAAAAEFAADASVSANYGEDNNGAAEAKTCVITIRIDRNFFVFFFKSICATILVVYGCLFCLLLHPADHTGDKCAIILVAILIVITQFQQDLKLGQLTYLIWLDLFNLAQIGVLVIGLIETMYIHYHWTQGREHYAVIVNRIAAITILCGIYPTLVAGLLLIWSQQPALGSLVIILGTLGPILLGVLWFTYKARARAHRQHMALHALRKGDPNDKETYSDLIETLFRAYDADSSDRLSQKELRALLKSMYPSLGRRDLSQALMKVRQLIGDQDMSFEDFLDVLDHMVSPDSGEFTNAGDAGGRLTISGGNIGGTPRHVPSEKGAHKNERISLSPRVDPSKLPSPEPKTVVQLAPSAGAPRPVSPKPVYSGSSVAPVSVATPQASPKSAAHLNA